MITYQDFFLFCTFIVALISLLYQIFKGKNSRHYLHGSFCTLGISTFSRFAINH